VAFSRIVPLAGAAMRPYTRAMSAPSPAAGSSTAEAFHAPSHPYRWAMLAGVWLVYFSFGVTVAAMAPLVAPITRDLGLTHSAMGTVLGAWPLVYIVVAVPCGSFIDRVGLRRALIISAGLIALSGLMRGLADGYASLFLAVAVFGIGGPLISIGAPKVMSLWFEGRERGLAMGLYISGPTLGNILSLSLTNSVMMPAFDGDWRMVLFLYGGVAVACGAAWTVISAHGASRAMERRIAAEPKAPPLEVFRQLMAEPAVRLILAMSVGIFVFNHGLNNWLPEILRAGGMAPAEAGYWASIPTAVSVLSALMIPRLATPERRLPIMAGLIVAAGAATLLLHLPAGVGLAAGLVAQGTARGALMAISLLLLVDARTVESKNAGAAGGLFFSAAEVGGVMGPVMIGALHDLTGGFASALVLLSADCLLLLALLAWLGRTMRRG
jgi:CP family cyanate transporter-like MFS transporter